jgi:hypothetical protein
LTIEEIQHEIETLTEQFSKFTIRGPGISGDSRQGFQYVPPVPGAVALAQSSGAAPPPPDPCPAHVTITFSGVVFDCGCVPADEGLTTSKIVTEGTGNFNSYLGVFNQGFHCFPSIGESCSWALGVSSGDLYAVTETYWTSNGTCFGDPDYTPFLSDPFVFLILKSGVYHLMAYDGYNSVLFYGTRTDLLGGPFLNTVFCNSSFVSWDNPVIDCILHGPQNFTSAAHSGSATVALWP